MAELTLKQMAQLIVGLRLATERQVQDCLAEVSPGDQDPEQLLAGLSRKGLLTSLQVDKLLKGDRHGYYMGSYRLLYKVHSGSFGRVYRADEPSSGRVVAVKVLRQRWTDKPEVIEMFEREGRLGLSLRHPNIVEVLSVGKEERTGQYYIVMEFVEGANLRDWLNIRKKFDTVYTLKLLEDVASALTHAYSKGITHRDMKPTNILVGSQGTTKITDYGLAQISSRFITEADKGSQQRTVDYAGLERATDAPYGDVRSDIFFTGCVAFEMLTGRAALAHTRSKHARMARDRFINVGSISLNEIEGPAAAATHRLITKMITLNPEQRFQTPAQLLDAVRQTKMEATGQRGAAGSTNLSVFLAENDEKLQDILRDKLKKMGYRVMIASDPARACDRFEQSPYHILIADVGTIGKEGIAATNRVLRQSRTVGMPCQAIVILSEDQDHFESSIEDDVKNKVSVLRRPLKMHELVSKLAEIAPALAAS